MAFGSMNESGDDAPMSEINVTPLVDADVGVIDCVYDYDACADAFDSDSAAHGFGKCGSER